MELPFFTLSPTSAVPPSPSVTKDGGKSLFARLWCAGNRVPGACARRKMQEATSPLPALSNGYQPLPLLYLGFLAIWAASGFSWAFSTWRNRHYQVLPEAIVSEFSFDVFSFVCLWFANYWFLRNF